MTHESVGENSVIIHDLIPTLLVGGVEIAFWDIKSIKSDGNQSVCPGRIENGPKLVWGVLQNRAIGVFENIFPLFHL